MWLNLLKHSFLPILAAKLLSFLNPGEFPTGRWPLDKYVRDEHWLQLPPDLPSGTYTLTTGLWVQAEGWRLPLLDNAGQQIGDVYVLGQITVR